MQEINKRLERYFGTLDGQPTFRLVRGGEIREKRKTENGVGEVNKYPFDGGYWILERRLPNPTPDYLIGNYTYEPMWIFRGPNNERQIPVWKAIELIIHNILYMEKDHSIRDIKSDKEYQQESQEICDFLDNESPEIPVALKDGEAIVVPANYGDEK